jgi:hypothetical protein
MNESQLVNLLLLANEAGLDGDKIYTMTWHQSSNTSEYTDYLSCLHFSVDHIYRSIRIHYRSPVAYRRLYYCGNPSRL